MSARILLLVSLLLLAFGCAGTLHESGKQIASGAIEASAEEAEEPDTRKALATVLSDPDVRAAVGDLSTEVTASAVDVLTEEVRIARLEATAQRLTAAVTAAMAENLNREAGPALERLVVRTVTRSLSEALGPGTEERLEALAAAAARGAFRGANEAVDGASFDAAVIPVGAIARQVSKQATLGFQDAVRMEASDPPAKQGEGEVLAALGETADATLSATPWLLWGLAALVFAACALAAYLLIQRRRDQQKARLVSAALDEAAEGSSAAEIRARVRRALGQPQGQS